jgi:hypothetical protein
VVTQRGVQGRQRVQARLEGGNVALNVFGLRLIKLRQALELVTFVLNG